MKQFFAALFVATVFSCAMQSSPILAAQAQDLDAIDPFLLLAQGDKKLTESEAAKRAQQRHGGKVVGVSCRESDGTVICSVRLDIDGRIKTVTIRG